MREVIAVSEGHPGDVFSPRIQRLYSKLATAISSKALGLLPKFVQQRLDKSGCLTILCPTIWHLICRLINKPRTLATRPRPHPHEFIVEQTKCRKPLHRGINPAIPAIQRHIRGAHVARAALAAVVGFGVGFPFAAADSGVVVLAVDIHSLEPAYGAADKNV